MNIRPDGKPLIEAPKEGSIYIQVGTDHTRKTFLMKNGSPVDLSNRHMRRAWVKASVLDGIRVPHG